MLPSFCTESVTVLRPGTKTLRGTEVPDWDNAERITVNGCSLQPASSSTRDGEARVNATNVSARLFLPPGSDIARGDRVEARGCVWRVSGVPLEHRSPTGRVSHIVCDLDVHEG